MPVKHKEEYEAWKKAPSPKPKYIRVWERVHRLWWSFREKYRSSEKIIQRTQFDRIYYSDPIIKRNRSIINWVKKQTREEARIAKIEYFISKWYDKLLLEKIY